ncbi:hypothetical protein DPMN_100934 [Dreissena polymorpha]|uniref:Peptidase A2 domain-containing protein n=1 Tax=Dreissena polymorpha TaxID=45954 RepID=A0A9D4LK55_DREPO|nr:hypothetical protein DPMN_100934 [Dreissena polymorpha]
MPKLGHSDFDLKLGNGVYLRGSVEGVPIAFTADTGSSRTIIAHSVYSQIPECKRPVLKGSAPLMGAGGSPIRDWGTARFKSLLGQRGAAVRCCNCRDRGPGAVGVRCPSGQ